MKFEIKTTGEDRTPGQVFRKWIMIGAVIGAAIVGFIGVFALGAVMVCGALAGAAVGVVVGAVKAVLSMFGR